jgi:hypothetical protein
VTRIAARLREMALPVRWALVGAVSIAVIGGTVGLFIGLFTYAPTAPFAVVELGLPSAIVGGVVGLAAGAVVAAAGRVKRTYQRGKK